jgi:hypothetical protein
MALPLPSPSALFELSRYAVGQVVETAAAVATIPVRLLSLVGQAELIATRITMIAENAEALVLRVAATAAEAEETIRETKVVVAAAALTADRAALVVAEAETVAAGAARVVGAAGAAAAEVDELLDGYAGTLRKAAPMAARFVDELSPEEITAAIKMIDQLPRLREHLTHDVMPLLGKLDQVGPDLHKLLEVTEDLRLAIAGLPGLKMLRRRGEDRAEDDTGNGR